VERGRVLLLGDSILKGVVVDEGGQKYITDNRMGLEVLEKSYGVTFENASHFGATVLKGQRTLTRLLSRGGRWDTVIMDYGGNESDWEWAEIAAAPEREHAPHLPLAAFLEGYRVLIRTVKEAGMLPVITTLPPLLPERFLLWRSRCLNVDAIRKWLGDVTNIYAFQESYSRAVERLAREEHIRILDFRGAFTGMRHMERFICSDGTHPNYSGQALIAGEIGRIWKT